ncbi:MAG: phenylacetate--CoA ligase [Deltaproteobacteria bacterium]|nr:phenylacetate--CoA ligase [Deltaproteobacteria bacterium]
MGVVEYFDQQVETASRDKLARLQSKKLDAMLKKVFASNPFYQNKFKTAGIALSDVRSVEDLHQLPFTVKKEFEKDQEEHPTFGSNLTEPLENYVQYHQTSGTTGKPLKFLDTQESWRWRGKVACHILKGAGVRKGDRILFPFNFGPYTAFWIMYEGAYQLGNLIIPTGGWNTLQRLQCIIDNQATVIPTTPSHALRLIDTANENNIDIANSSVRILMLSGEPGALVPGIREKLERLWNAKCFDYIGLTEVGTWGFQCTEELDGVHIIESEFIAEVVNPETELPVQEGEIGELVLTNLGRSCMPAIRYRSGDLVKVKKGICPCGRTFRVLHSGVLGRKDEMLIIRGVNVFPNVLANIVESHIQPGDDYQIEVFKEAGIDEVAIKLETKEKGKGGVIQRTIQDEIKSKLNLRMEVKIVPAGSLPKFDFKAKRFVDRRKDKNT